MKRRKYAKETKDLVTRDIFEYGGSVLTAAEKYSIPMKTVENWVTAYNKDPEVFKIDGKDEAQTLEEMTKEIKRLRRDNEILKKTLSSIIGKK